MFTSASDSSFYFTTEVRDILLPWEKADLKSYVSELYFVKSIFILFWKIT